MPNKKIRVAITQGDTNGIGYELIFKAFDDPEMFDLCTPIIYGSPQVAAYHSNALGIEEKKFSIIANASEAADGQLNVLPAVEDEVKVELGTPSEDANGAAMKALDRALTDYKDSLFDVLVTAPVNRSDRNVEGYEFPSTDRFIEGSIGEGKQAIDLRVSDNLKMSLLTGDIALKDVPAAVTEDALINHVAALYATLRRDFLIDNPRIAMLALNPTDSDDHPGHEETEAIVPAVQRLADADVCVFGPYQAGRFFALGQQAAFDAVVAMYHDQGVAPFNALRQEYSYRFLGGLPLIVTAPDQGPAYDIAGQGKADATSMRHAIWAAVDALRNRASFDEPYANPLPKLYKERKDDGEKARFVPKRREE